MAVDDQGIEVLKKSGEEVTPGNKSDYFIKVGFDSSPISASNPLPVTSSTGATEATLQSVLAAVDGLEGFTDGLEGLITSANSLLTTINSNVDQLEGFTDGLETLISSSNTLLTTINSNVDQLEGFTDGIEGLLTTTNSLLTTIRDNSDQLEGYLDGVEGLLLTISATLTSIETFVSSIDTKFDVNLSTRASEATLLSISSSVDQLEGYLDGVETLLTAGNASLASIDTDIDVSLSTRASESTLSSFQSANHSDLLSIQTKLDTVNTNLVTVQSKQDSQTTQLTAINANTDTLETKIGDVAETAPVSDTASSGLNGRLQRIAQRITSLIAVVATETTLSALNAKIANNYGAASGAVRTASQIGNTTGAADFGVGNVSAQTIRVVTASDREERATFSAVATQITIGNGKSMFSILNASGSAVIAKIREIKIVNTRTTAITGIVAEFQALRITNHASGTSITPISFDTSDSLNGSITSQTGATLTGTGTIPLLKEYWSSDEWGTGTSDVESSDHVIQTLIPLYTAQRFCKPITLRAGEGLTINQITNSTAGTFDIYVTFTQETS